jgi:murE/murF fusion protein
MSPLSHPRTAESAAHVAAWLRERVPAGADLRLDSREVQPGDVFVACAGGTLDGGQFVADAVARGAAAVLCETEAEGTVPTLHVPGLRTLLGTLADDWYGQPSAGLTVVAITGTNGKTSVVRWIAQALTAQGKPCGSIGTLGSVLPNGEQLAGTLTTPDVLTIHRLLAAMRRAGADLVALEASSIGIEQGRLDGVRIAAAGFTNLTRDHLDYHGSMQSYEAAKQKLFVWPGLTAAVINLDDPAGLRMAEASSANTVLGFSLDASRGNAKVAARDMHPVAQGQVFTLVLPEGEAQIVTPLLGTHNISNLLLVAAVLYQLGWTLATIAGALSSVSAVDGRLETVEPIGAVRGPLVVVDYAHTPDALERVLGALRPVAEARGGKLICLFGCGGDRDPGKRPEMGRIAAQLADAVCVTSDNPRRESPEAIMREIMAGMPPGSALAVADRAAAVMRTIWSAQAEDVVLLAGKGHETYQDANGVKTPFDDREWSRLSLLLPHAAGVSTDTRAIRAQELFVALVGASFDGHDYLGVAQAAGASAAVVAYRVAGAGLPQIVLGDTGQALMRIGAAWRQRHDMPVIAVAGSNGKTTTKEMVSAILADWLGEENRLATAGNLNNEIGVPLTLLRLTARHRAAVIELGMNHPGEIAGLAAMAAPTVALITNAQREHQEFMHTVEAVAVENGAALEALPADGVAVYPGDDAHAAVWDGMAIGRQRLRFGLRAGLDVYAEQIHADENETRCRVVTPQGAAELRLSVPGLHNLRNALAAIAATLAAGVGLSAAVRALGAFTAVSGRMQRRRMSNGSLLIDDTYNANPDSVRAAIDVLAGLPGRRVLVLGDMGEVGANGPAMHREVGEYARDCGVDVLLTLGTAASAAAEVFGSRAQACGSIEEIVDTLVAMQADSVLVKGSRFMRMERVVMGFSDTHNNPASGHGDPHAA